jgi:phage terminase large subunit GpA-like protein
LPKEVGAFQCDFSLEYGPHLYGIFAALDDPAVEEVYCMKAAQVLWTTALIAYIFKRIAVEPGVFLGMFASESAARKFSQTKLAPMGRVTRPIAAKMSFEMAARKGQSTLRKEFEGGFLELFGSNAASNVKSTTANFVFVEEPDDANENVNNQGDSIKLLYERTKRVRRPKKVLGGSPTVKGFSRVEEHIELSDKRVLPIACHECGEKHVLDIDNLVGWEAEEGAKGVHHPIYGLNKPENAVYACPRCGVVWDDFQRKENILDTITAAMEAGDELCGWERTIEGRPGIAGFTRLNELYSRLPGAGHAKLVADMLEAEHYAAMGDMSKKIVFVNNKRGEPYEFKDGREDAETLRSRAKADPESARREGLVPAAGYVVTAGIDVQDNRLAIRLRAHGRDRRSWLIYADEIYAKSTTINEQDPVWNELDSLMFKPYEREDGTSAHVAAISIDSGGHATDAVYDWVLTRAKRYPAVRIMAVKGSSSTADVPIFAHPTSRAIEHKDPAKRTKADRKGVKVFIVGTNRAKDFLAEQMQLNSQGIGRFHFYQVDQMRADYFDQLLAEAKVPGRSGKPTWQKKAGCAAEFWDCEVYGEHAARAMRVHLLNESEWDALELKAKQSDLFADAEPLEVTRESDGAAPERRKSNYWSR